MRRCISSQIFNAGFAERLLTLRAFVAPATVFTVSGREARETQMQRQSLSAANDLFFAELAKGGDDFRASFQGFAGSDGEVAEEFRSRVGKRIVVERANRDGANPM